MPIGKNALKRVTNNGYSNVTTSAPDMENFLGLKLAYEAGTTGGSLPTVYNAANEWAVGRFLDYRIGYLDIIEGVRFEEDVE